MSGNDQADREELAASMRGLAKKARLLSRLGDDRLVDGAVFKRVTQDAIRLLEAAAEVLFRPGMVVPRLPNEAASLEPSTIAREMTRGPVFSAQPASTPNPPSSSVSSLSGSTEDFSVPDLLQFLGALRKSGVLFVRCSKELFTVHIEDGQVVHATSNNAPSGDRLGDLLISGGMITKQQFDAFLTRYTRAAGKIGVALEREELVTREQLASVLETQVQRLFHRMFNAPGATFSFQQRAVHGVDHRINLSMTQLLLESARALDESGR